MRHLLLYILIFSLSSCFDNGIQFEKSYYEKISGIKFPTKYTVLETFDNGEFITGTVFKIDSTTLIKFVLDNHFDTLRNLQDIHLISENYLTRNKPVFEATNNIYFISKSAHNNDWRYVADLNSGKLWAEIMYPDWSGDGSESLNSQAHPEKDTSLIGIDTTLKSFLFGIYCGECYKHCATMYQYNLGGNSNTLLVDSSDSYFKKNGKVQCNIPIADIDKFYLAQSIYRHIPSRFLTTTDLTETFGCPDCNDGCGIYFELRQEETIKRFNIDYNTEKLPPDVKTFAEYLKTVIQKLKSDL